MQCLPVRLRINSNRENSHLTARPDNPDRDLPTVCNQNFSNHCAAPTIKVSSACATTLPSTEATASPTPIGPLWRIIFVSRRSLSPGFTFLKTALVDAAEKCNFSLILVKRKNRNRTDLRQRLDNQHTRHHRLLRKMTRKKILAVRHTFIPNAEFARLKIFYVIHQQKRMSVWNNLLNLLRCQTVHSLLPFSSRLYAFTRNSGFP